MLTQYQLYVSPNTWRPVRCDCGETSGFLPLALAGWDSWGDAGLLGVCVSAGVTGTGTWEGSWAGGGDAWGDGGRPAGGADCTGSAGGLGTGSKNKDDTWETLVSSSWYQNKLICTFCPGMSAVYLVRQSVWRAPPSGEAGSRRFFPRLFPTSLRILSWSQRCGRSLLCPSPAACSSETQGLPPTTHTNTEARTDSHSVSGSDLKIQGNLSLSFPSVVIFVTWRKSYSLRKFSKFTSWQTL